jgi:hypothetical protein
MKSFGPNQVKRTQNFIFGWVCGQPLILAIELMGLISSLFAGQSSAWKQSSEFFLGVYMVRG